MGCSCGDIKCDCLLVCSCTGDLCQCRLCTLARNNCCCMCGLPCDTAGQNVCQCFLEIAASSLPVSPFPSSPDHQEMSYSSDLSPFRLETEVNPQLSSEEEKQEVLLPSNIDSSAIPSVKHCSPRKSIHDIVLQLANEKSPESQISEFTSQAQNIKNKFLQVDKDTKMTYSSEQLGPDILPSAESQLRAQSSARTSTVACQETICYPQNTEAQKHQHLQNFLRVVEPQYYNISGTQGLSANAQTQMTRQDFRNSSFTQSQPTSTNISQGNSFPLDSNSVESVLDLTNNTKNVLGASCEQTNDFVEKPSEATSEHPIDYTIRGQLDPSNSISTKSNIPTMKITQHDNTSAKIPSHVSPRPFYYPFNTPLPVPANQAAAYQVQSVTNPQASLPTYLFSPTGFLDYSRFPQTTFPPPYRRETRVAPAFVPRPPRSAAYCVRPFTPYASERTLAQVRASVQEWLNLIPDQPSKSKVASGSVTEDLRSHKASSAARFERYTPDRKVSFEGRFRERSPINQEVSPTGTLDSKNRAKMLEEKNLTLAKKTENVRPSVIISSTAIVSNDTPQLTSENNQMKPESASQQMSDNKQSESEHKIQREVSKLTVKERQRKDKKKKDHR